jgi:hypothetical protein
LFPGVPTTAEAGLPGIEAIVWNGIFVPAGTPRPVIQILHHELVKAYNAPDVKNQVVATGSEVTADNAGGIRRLRALRVRQVEQGHTRREHQAGVRSTWQGQIVFPDFRMKTRKTGLPPVCFVSLRSHAAHRQHNDAQLSWQYTITKR